MPLLLSDRAATVSPLPLTTTAEARMLGIRLSGAIWVRVRKGVYADRHAFSALPPWGKYAVRVHAFARKHPDAVLSHESAAVLHGLPLFGETRDIHVFDPDRAASRRFGDVCVHTSVDHRESQLVHGAPVTGLLDTAIDLARVLPPAQALAMLDATVSPAQGGSLTLLALRERADAQSNARGRARLRWLWTHVDDLAESPAESVSRAIIEWMGFERPQLQHEFRYEGRRDRVDFFFRSCRAIGEADGWQKYDLDDPARAAVLLAEEKRREDRLRRHGHPFARWDLADAWRVDPLARALVAAGVPRVTAPSAAFLASLGRRPREKPRAA